MAILSFDATSVAPGSSFDPLPAGWYHVKITDSENRMVNPPKTGSYLALVLSVIDGPYHGRQLFHNLNLVNENPIAVKIAYEQLSALCYVTGNIQCQDSQQLHGIPFQVKLAVKPSDGTYDASNNVKGFRNAAGQDPKDIAMGVAPVSNQPPAPPSAPTVSSVYASDTAASKSVSAPVCPMPPKAPPAPSAPPVVTYDPLLKALAEGWTKHPEAEGYYYKGQEVMASAEVAALYPAPVAATTVPALPKAPPAPPKAPSAPAAVSTMPPWAKPVG